MDNYDKLYVATALFRRNSQELCYICFAVLHVFNSLCRVLIIPNITHFFLVWKQFITDRIHNLALRNLRFKAGGSVVKNWCSFAFYVIWATVLVSEIHFLYNCDLLFRWHIKLRFYIPIIHICVKNYKKKTPNYFKAQVWMKAILLSSCTKRFFLFMYKNAILCIIKKNAVLSLVLSRF